MWVIAGILIGLVLLGSLVGFHSGPHTHIAAAVTGILAAGWLVFMVADGRSAPVLWVLLSADLVVSSGVGFVAWKGLSSHGAVEYSSSLEGAEAVAVTDLEPEGIVRVRGEEWSAVSVNGTVRSGSRVHILRAAGVRLEVWGEDAEVVRAEVMFSLDDGDSKELST